MTKRTLRIWLIAIPLLPFQGALLNGVVTQGVLDKLIAQANLNREGLNQPFANIHHT